jgi:hypothetical protein
VPAGTVNVAGRTHSLDPIVISLSTNDKGFAYDGGLYTAAVLTLGRNTKPEIRPVLSKANWMSMVVRSNSHGVMTICLSSILLDSP